MQGYVDAVLDLASHFLTRLRRYASFCRTLAAHAAAGNAASTTPLRSSAAPSTTTLPLAPVTPGMFVLLSFEEHENRQSSVVLYVWSDVS